MKVSKAIASNNRIAILEAAAAQLRGCGFDQLSVARVAEAAGLTHGALYSHFESKAALTIESIRRAFDGCIEEFSGHSISEFLRRYLSTRHRDDPEKGCPTAALVSDIPRQPAAIQAAFRRGVDDSIALVGESLKSVGATYGPDQAVFVFAAMVGGLALSRAVREVDEPASAEILRGVCDHLRLIASEPGNRPHSLDRDDMRQKPDACLFENLRAANRAMARYCEEYLLEANLNSTQFTVLMHLRDLGETSITPLARAIGTDRTTMSRNIGVLERLGHVQIVGTADRRERNVRLTQKGIATLKRAVPLWQKAQQDLHHIVGHDTWTNVARQMRMLASVQPPARKRTRK